MISRFLGKVEWKSHDLILYNHLKKMSKGFYPGLTIIVFVSESENLTSRIHKLTLLQANCLISLLSSSSPIKEHNNIYLPHRVLWVFIN